jgi:hypothetical protein
LEDDGEGIGSSDVGGGSTSGRIAGPGSDKSKTIPGERRTVKATVEAIEKATRSLTLKGPEGNYVNVTVPEEVKRFDSLKVGDTITAIDPSAPSITFKGPNDWIDRARGATLTTYSLRVQDRDVLKKVKVGDRVDITWTEALLISVE